MTELIARLKSHERDGIIQEPAELKSRARKEHKAKNKEAEDAKWLEISMDEKAKFDFERYVKEAFPKDQKSLYSRAVARYEG